MIVVGSCYFLLTLLIPYDPNIDFVFPLTISTSDVMCVCCILFLLFFICKRTTTITIITILLKLRYNLVLYFIMINVYILF